MDLSDYLSSAPSDLNLLGKVKEIQLLKVYAFNAYFNADENRTEDVNNGCTFRIDQFRGIDGVYINETLDENSIECLYSYCVENGVFDLNKIYRTIDKIVNEIDNVNKHLFINNKEADDLLNDYISQSDNKKIIIRIITDFTCDDNTKYDYSQKIENYKIQVNGLDVSVTICFGNDVIEAIESNKAPFDYVESGKIKIDKPSNLLYFEDHSFVCNISANSLKQLWKSDGQKGLLAMNLRYYIKSKNIDNKIDESIRKDSQDFWYLNNGIIIVCSDYKIKDDEIYLKEFSIVNGGQTTRMIGEIPFENDFYICCKVIKNIFETSNDKNLFISKVAEASNTQKPIKAKDIIANRIEQRNLKSLMQENNIFIEIKRGEKYNHDLYKEPWQKTKNNELAQDLYAFVYQQPGPARNNVSSILSNNDKYDVIFKNHTYSFEFLRDLLFLEKAYREYQKKINKLNDPDPKFTTKKGLVKNGLYYCLAIIGYVLKFYYNTEFKNNINKYRNLPTKYDAFSSELAFDNAFIDPNLSYKDFKLKIYDLFDIIFKEFIINKFEIAKQSAPTLVYSNWTKTNTGFDSIRDMINYYLFDLKDYSLFNIITSYFLPIDNVTMTKNIDLYANYCINNKSLKSTNTSGYVLSNNDKALRDELMMFRLNYSQTKNIKENKIFNDKMIDKMVINKPTDKKELGKIISADSVYYAGDEILKIIVKYL